jgi:SAM-dependent methyltransferase
MNTGAGIDIPKVIFREGESLPPDLSSCNNDPQNIWFSLENSQRWAADRILALGTPLAYMEQEHEPQDELTASDSLRESRDKFADNRGLNALGVLFMVDKKSKLSGEFEGKTVIDIGSGSGVLANDLRKRAHANVTEVDFSEKALGTASPIFKNMGKRILADATDLSAIEDGSFDASISLYSTMIHTETIHRRLKSFTETLRVTKVGGRAFFAPFIGGMVMRHNHWTLLEQAVASGKIEGADDERLLAEATNYMRQNAAMEFSLVGLTKALIASGAIDFRPRLVIGKISGEDKDAVSAVCDVNETITIEQADDLINPYLELFSPVAS